MNESEKLHRARERVEAMTGFYVHLAVFIVVMTALIIIDWRGEPNEWWVQWPLLGWGLGMVMHALLVFGHVPRFVKQWQLRKIREIKDTL